MSILVFVSFFIYAAFGAEQETNLFPDECGQITHPDHVGPHGEIGEYPWLVVIEYDTVEGKQLIGGGVLINDQYVLTNAHCLKFRASDLLTVRLGENDLSRPIDCDSKTGKICADPLVTVPVETIIRHPEYSGESSPFFDPGVDLALIRLKEKVKFSKFIKPICLPKGKNEGETYVVAGWSLTKDDQSDVQWANTVHEVQDCSKNPRLSFVKKDQVCAGLPNENVCMADNGGPLMGFEKRADGSTRHTVFGVSFFGVPCLLSTLPEVFTRVLEYVPWIKKTVLP